MPITLNGDSGITTPTYGGTDTSEYLVPVTAFKNRIINGAMQIDQRNAGASVTQDTTVKYTLDRWWCFGSVTSKFTVQQNAGAVTPPAGFTNYLGATSSSAYTVGAGEIFQLAQRIEGFNFADLAWGTANAQTVTLSFWVRSSLTGTFGGALRNAAANRSYPFSYTVSSANTWEQKTVTIAGDTTGTWLTTNGIGCNVYFSLGTGSTFSGTAGAWSASNFQSATGAISVVGTNGATFYITGVQLEKGSNATSFDYRPYGTELQLCQRYYFQYGASASSEVPFSSIGMAYSSTKAYATVLYPVQMRSSPSLGRNGSNWYWPGFGGIAITNATIPVASVSSCIIDVTVASGLTNDRSGWIASSGTTSFLSFSAEL
jgi:hypothetical protein